MSHSDLGAFSMQPILNVVRSLLIPTTLAAVLVTLGTPEILAAQSAPAPKVCTDVAVEVDEVVDLVVEVEVEVVVRPAAVARAAIATMRKEVECIFVENGSYSKEWSWTASWRG